MKKIVITGGAGFIGGHIAEEASKRGHEVLLFDNLSTGSMKNVSRLKKCCSFFKGDIMNTGALRKAFRGADTVFHLAARISVAESMNRENEYVLTNSVGTLNVLAACRACGVKNTVLSSSAAIYGDNPVIPKTEKMLPEPKSPYAVTKLDGEYYFSMYKREYGINAVVLRYFNVYGPGQNPKSQYAAAIPIFIENAVKGRDIIIYGDGEQTRDFVYVKDIVQANFLAAEKGGDLYNVSNSSRITINEIARNIIELTGSSSRIVHEKERPGDIKHSMGDNSKIRNELGFSVSYNLHEGLKHTVAYFLELKNNKL
ncbi:MAG: dTDP-glucose 4,6-dehydratase [Spirochaetes bacterium GWF1_41_5]|nr:MAG: dTDP-glucose 4,6-dehydratase [Spirochaetes bacterium GWF1_41_5]